MQSANIAATPPCGLWLSASFARVDKPSAIDLNPEAGDDAPSRISRRVPAHMAVRAAASVSNSRTSTEAPASKRAG